MNVMIKTTRWLERYRNQLHSNARTKGQAYVEFILVLPLFMMIIAGVVGFGQLLYTKLAMEAAAWSGARHAIATLNQSRGISQASLGERYALDGFGLNPDNARSQVTIWGAWGRGTQVRVRVCYNVPMPPVPMGQALAPQQVCASQTMPVYKWKSKW
jgi:hypothetical protein